VDAISIIALVVSGEKDAVAWRIVCRPWPEIRVLLGKIQGITICIVSGGNKTVEGTVIPENGLLAHDSGGVGVATPRASTTPPTEESDWSWSKASLTIAQKSWPLQLPEGHHAAASTKA